LFLSKALKKKISLISGNPLLEILNAYLGTWKENH